MPSLFRCFLLIVVLTSICLPARAGQIVEAVPTDENVTSTVVGNTEYDHLYTLLAGTLFSGDNGNIVEAFALPYLAPGQTVTAASISFYLNKQVPTPATSPNYNLSLYGLKRVSTTNSAPLVTDWYTGTNDAANTLLTSSFCTPATPLNSLVTYSGANLASFVNSQYANPAFTGMDTSSTRYIFLRLNADSNVQNNGVCNYEFGSGRNPDRQQHPTLSLTISGGISNIAGRLQFSFNLPDNSPAPDGGYTTSAGVYNATTGVLLRTLWNNVRYPAGTNYGFWDGNDDSGKPLATGTNYQIKLIYHNVQYIWQGMVGNTSTAQSGANVFRSFAKIHDMAFTSANGYYTVAYNELECPFHKFVIGSPQVPIDNNLGYNLVDPYSCMYYVTTDGVRTYWAKTFGGISGTNTFVIAINNTDSSFYTFPKGTAMTYAYNQIYPSCCDFDPAPNQANAPNGIAVQKTGNYLFVSHGNLNLVRVFDKVQGNLVGSFTVKNPGRVACTANGDVWVISYGSSPTVLRYTFANGTATLQQTLTGFTYPAGVGVSTDDSLVLVTDGGTSQQIKAFDNSTGAPAWTYGQLGGNNAVGPTMTTDCFDFNVQEANLPVSSNEAFIAFQPDGTFWLQDEGNYRVLHFSITGTTLKYLEQISYCDASYRSTTDLTDATRVFNSFMEYKVNYSVPLGGTNGSWSIANNWSAGLPSDATHNYFGFANGLINVVTMSNGRTYGFMENYYNSNFDLFELPATGPARFTGYSFASSLNPLIYSDSTLRYNVENGTGTTAAFYSQPLTGFDSANNPVWGSPALLASATLNPATDPIPWNAFPMRTEVTANGTVIDFGGNQANTGYHLGGLAQGGTTSWKWKASPSINGPFWFPQDGKFDIGNGVQYAGNYALALDRNIIYGYHGEFWEGGEASQWVNFLDNGLMVGRFGTYGNVSSITLSTPGFAGNSFSPSLVHAPDGNTYLYHNDEGNHGGTIRWQISGWENITEMNGTGAVGSVISLNSSTAGPTVGLTSPTGGAAYDNGSNINFSAQAASSGASIASVQFMDGSTSLGTVTTAPFVMPYSGLSAGSHVITAKATDSNGLTASSPAVTITVGGDGTTAPPPAPVSLSTSDVSASSITLNWTEPAIGTTSSTNGQIISFQFDSAGDPNALKPTDVAGAAPDYATSNFNLLGTSGTPGLTFINPLNNAGTVVTNLGLNTGLGGSASTHSTQSLTSTALKLFSTEISTQSSTAIAVSVSNIPFANYDVVVYSLPGAISDAAQTTKVTVNNVVKTSVITQTFAKGALPTGYTIGKVAFGSNATLSGVNAIVVQGLSGPLAEIQGTNIAGFQIVERPYDQGTPTSYNILRATGSSGTFAVVGTASGSATSFTDTSALAASTTYQYEIQAVNGFGNSAPSSSVTVTTPASTKTSTTSFASWQSQYFTADQLADPTISGPTADPYGSGVPNLLAYALQLNPSTARPTDVPSPVITNGHLTVTYFVPNAITDITYIVEVSSDLVNWNSGPGYTEVISSVANAGGTTITVQDDLPATTQKHFMRLRVTQNQ